MAAAMTKDEKPDIDDDEWFPSVKEESQDAALLNIHQEFKGMCKYIVTKIMSKEPCFIFMFNKKRSVQKVRIESPCLCLKNYIVFFYEPGIKGNPKIIFNVKNL